jgi:hypothetical protein
MEPKKRRPLRQIITIILIVLGVLLVILFIFLVRNYLSLRRANLINRRELSLSAFVQKHGALNASEVGVIRPWMTFDYINRIFGFPKDYLKNQLQISDPRYPNITLGSSETVSEVQAAIVNYFNQSGT